MFLHSVPSLIQHLFPSITWKVKTQEKIIYLTFDDGPIPEVTPWVLDELKRANAKATFFCVGENVERNPQLFQRIIAEGHRVGNHTHNHLNGWETQTKDYLDNVDKASEAMTPGTDLFRPPYGRLKLSQFRSLKDLRVVMWDVLSGDFSPKLSPERILKKSIDLSGQGSIIVFHDHVKAFQNLQYALPRYLDHFKKKGYQFEVL